MLSSLKYALSNGTDMHSIVDAVAFANPAEGDCSLSDSSTAVKKGKIESWQGVEIKDLNTLG